MLRRLVTRQALVAVFGSRSGSFAPLRVRAPFGGPRTDLRLLDRAGAPSACDARARRREIRARLRHAPAASDAEYEAAPKFMSLLL
jgi:hypothetical protein